ncbi:MAG: trans-2-enoyl-CoA reductase family protein [Deinococcales bacterium]
MIIEPKIRGFICTTAHPKGCAANVQEQIAYVKGQVNAKGKLAGAKRVLVVGSSTGYGLASRIVSAFACGASTIGVFFDKAGTEKKTGTAGWYNMAAFDQAAKAEGLYSKSFNADAFAHETKSKVTQQIKEDLGQIDLLVYSIASPVRKMPDSGELARSTLKPIGQDYSALSVNTNKDEVVMAHVEAASEQEIADTIKVMGGQDWQLWVDALEGAEVLAQGFKTVAYSYIGTEITWPLYWHGTIGKAKEDLEKTAANLRHRLEPLTGQANVCVLKSVVTQASSAIPVLPLYISIVFKVMKEKGLHEGCIEQIDRLFRSKLYDAEAQTDSEGRLRVDDWELREEVQAVCRQLWGNIDTASLFEKSDYQGYKDEFLRLFGFGLAGVDYQEDLSTVVDFDVVELEPS